ncbi:MAG: PD-(D/E)XK nuclease domain-containing protein [Turicibacter sp.]|nr:PD-(D/E)XK nuclease domain-containing protein [Turicibacter sp.]
MLKSLHPLKRPHMFFEFKVGENLPKEAKKALGQIFEKKYFITLKGPVLCVGIAHDGKDCEMEYQLIEN